MDSALVPPVTARSAVLSLLLGANPPTLSGREIIGAMDLFGITESTTRVALTRMVANGDLTRDRGVYTLSERLAQRQRYAQPPEQRDWTGTWEMAVVTATGRSAADRVALREEMRRQRVAELREGVWTRPANLRRRWPQALLDVSVCFESRPTSDPAALAAQLWDLPAWSARGNEYLALIADVDDEPARFRTMVAAVHHLQTDPLLPAEFLPVDWPAAQLTSLYDDYRAWLAELRDSLAPVR
ncbi:PaaX family transcriptional regulator [Tsukamurella tyrosinosolvens]|uniref:PaaX family transcriptional regulator C-terminal domain-containing protein n=1 Tax=Tsukamurella tyrosinosolvens TaxID=57704 RepID=UPI00079920D3|nr:PaaX family transcriptional regulator C-terminal domain-containing protein [Tsukamurella tyrosinosolvens]KXP01788.1 PaaX family transcriptional regulator [Tsukamurella tyrosinosolvens]KZL94978.1 PaaX family transcriptional regulator [Tsukamurella tyrosinosolvens]MCA4997781.1 PaaX family transcriptional regulator [Tsukamurella tyrosinosolvens]